jgi:hypothetical protein
MNKMENQRDVQKLALKLQILNSDSRITEADFTEGQDYTIQQIRQMPARLYYWKSLYDSAAIDKALEREANKASGRLEIERNKAQRFWENPNADPQQVQACFNASETFISQNPAFDPTSALNRREMGAELSRLKLIPTTPEVLQSCYQSLALAGRLELIIENDPRAPRTAPSTPTTGVYLQRWIRELPELLEPIVAASAEELEAARVQALSSEDFKREFMPAPITQREYSHNRRESAEFEKRHQEIDFDVEGVWQAIADALTDEGLGVRYNDLEYIIRTPKLIARLQEMNAFWTTTPATEYKSGISSLIDRRVEKAPLPSQPVEIRELPRRWTRRQILDMSSQEYSDNLLRFGKAFEDAVNEAF